jgi:DNA-binding PadR family transcriptional regulator
MGTSDNNRKARFYTLTRKGRTELTREESEWRRIAGAITRILGPSHT